MALPPRVPSESSEAKMSFFAAARDLMVSVIHGSSTASSSTSLGSGTSSWTTTYTSSRDSALSSELGDLASQLQCIDEEEKAKRRERGRRHAKEVSRGGGNNRVLERWLSEMGVAWVLHIAADPSAVTSLLRAQPPQRNNLAGRWIRALIEITESTHLEYLHLRRLVVADGQGFVRGTDVPGRVQLLRFVEAAVLKMLPFVDALLAAGGSDTTGVSSNGAQVPSEKLQALVGVLDALPSASEGILQISFPWNSLAELKAQESKLLNLLSEKEHRLGEAIWNTMEEVRTSILNDGDDNNDWGFQTLQGSPGICKVTRSVVTCIKYLWNNYSLLNHIVCSEAELGSYVPNRDVITSFLLSAEEDEASPLITLALEMVSSLQVKLAKRSESFPDHSLRFLFLINNTHFIWQQLHTLFSMKDNVVIGLKIKEYIQEYLQASWALVMSCLNNDTPHCFRKNSALPKFDLEFQKTYTAQKLWKVPDPELRTRLRKAIVEEVIPGLAGYLEANNITSPAVTPQEREEMLLELFEG